MSNYTLEAQVNQLEGKWQKTSAGDYKLSEVLENFTQGLQPDEKLLGWISCTPKDQLSLSLKNIRIVSGALLLLTDKRLIVCEDHITKKEFSSMPLESITSIDTSTAGLFGSNFYLTIKEVARTTSFHTFTKEFSDKFFTALSNAHIAAKAKPTIPPQTSAAGSDPISQLERLAELRAKGILTEEEFLAQKRKVLGTPLNTPVSQKGHQARHDGVGVPPIIQDESGATNRPPPLFNLMLVSVPADRKIGIIQAVRKVKANLGLAEAKLLVETLPSKVLEGVSEAKVRAAKELLEQAGAGANCIEMPGV